MNLQDKSNSIQMAHWAIRATAINRALRTEEELKEMREALEWYAIRGNNDYGHRARDVLSKWGETREQQRT